jgi:hypothetical protein
MNTIKPIRCCHIQHAKTKTAVFVLRRRPTTTTVTTQHHLLYSRAVKPTLREPALNSSMRRTRSNHLSVVKGNKMHLPPGNLVLFGATQFHSPTLESHMEDSLKAPADLVPARAAASHTDMCTSARAAAPMGATRRTHTRRPIRAPPRSRHRPARASRALIGHRAILSTCASRTERCERWYGRARCVW